MLAPSIPMPPNLAEHRTQKGISLSQIGDITKIGVRYLQAIEWGDIAKVPGGVYCLSYVRQYARAVDYDEQVLVACYRQAVEKIA
jgi:cytoskeletal protein RodZ